jgi:hypothetical protein
MIRGRSLQRLLAACLVLLVGVLSAAPAAAAPCTSNCYRYRADLTVSAWTSPVYPVFPGSLHYYTVRVTNTGWRTGGLTGPVQWPGPESGRFYTLLIPDSLEEFPVPRTGWHDFGPAVSCTGYHGPNDLACGEPQLQTGESLQFTRGFQAPMTSGFHTITIRVDSYTFQEHDENNNTVVLTYYVV